MFFKSKKLLLEPGCSQDIGKRDYQEDAFGFSDFYNVELSKAMGYVAVLADGMGGMQNSDVASQTAVDHVLRIFSDDSVDEPVSETLKYSLSAANEAVCDLADKLELAGSVGTTLITCVVKENMVQFLSVGDSPMFLYRDKTVTQLNEEHCYGSILDEKVKSGEISEEEALADPERSHLTSYLGLEELEYVDINQEPFKLQKGDLILMSSDGLTNTLDEVTIAKLIEANIKKSAQDISDVLLSAVEKANFTYQDNVTIIVLKYLGK